MMKALFLFLTFVISCSNARTSFPSAMVRRIKASTWSQRHEHGYTSSIQTSQLMKELKESCNILYDVRLKNLADGRLAFLHRSRGISITLYQTTQTTPTPSTAKCIESNHNALGSALTLRGGASSTTLQNMMESMLNSSLPAPIKQLIQMICKLLEDLTGWKMFPEKSKKAKAKAKKAQLDEVLVEDVSLKRGSKSRHSKSCKVGDEDRTESFKETKAAESIKEDDSDDDNTTTTIQATTMTLKPKPKADAASKKFLSNNLISSNPNYRIQRELKDFISSPPPGLSVKISGKNVRLWIVSLTMPENTIYSGEIYKLRIQFPANYPTSPPSVYFLTPTPRHEHVYTNGDICLSLLGKDWRPIMTAQSLAQAIMSILCGAQRKSLPMDNSRHAGNKPGQRQDDWVYHDDNC